MRIFAVRSTRSRPLFDENRHELVAEFCHRDRFLLCLNVI
jgi:hypothetical protein